MRFNENLPATPGNWGCTWQVLGRPDAVTKEKMRQAGVAGERAYFEWYAGEYFAGGRFKKELEVEYADGAADT